MGEFRVLFSCLGAIVSWKFLFDCSSIVISASPSSGNFCLETSIFIGEFRSKITSVKKNKSSSVEIKASKDNEAGYSFSLLKIALFELTDSLVEFSLNRTNLSLYLSIIMSGLRSSFLA